MHPEFLCVLSSILRNEYIQNTRECVAKIRISVFACVMYVPWVFSKDIKDHNLLGLVEGSGYDSYQQLQLWWDLICRG